MRMCDRGIRCSIELSQVAPKAVAHKSVEAISRNQVAIGTFAFERKQIVLDVPIQCAIIDKMLIQSMHKNFEDEIPSRGRPAERPIHTHPSCSSPWYKHSLYALPLAHTRVAVVVYQVTSYQYGIEGGGRERGNAPKLRPGSHPHLLRAQTAWSAGQCTYGLCS